MEEEKLNRTEARQATNVRGMHSVLNVSLLVGTVALIVVGLLIF